MNRIDSRTVELTDDEMALAETFDELHMNHGTLRSAILTLDHAATFGMLDVMVGDFSEYLSDGSLRLTQPAINGDLYYAEFFKGHDGKPTRGGKWFQADAVADVLPDNEY